MNPKNLPSEVRTKYEELKMDEESIKQEIARCCNMIRKYDTKRMLLRRAIRVKGAGAHLNNHQRSILRDNQTPTHYLNKAQALRIKLDELRAEHCIIKDTLSIFESTHNLMMTFQPYSEQLKEKIVKNAEIEGFLIASTIDSVQDSLFIENDSIRIYASPFWDIDDEEKDNSQYLQVDVYLKNEMRYMTTTVKVSWSYDLDKDIKKWETICYSVIATLNLKEVDPTREL